MNIFEGMLKVVNMLEKIRYIEERTIMNKILLYILNYILYN